MKVASFIFMLCILLCGCQSPLVIRHDMVYEADVLIDGKSETLTKKYSCHYENVTYFSERGSEWHDRKDIYNIRIVGSLPDGTAFEVAPKKIGWGNLRDFCTETERHVESRLYLRKGISSVDSFDSSHTVTADHAIQVNDARVRFVASGVDAFVSQQDSKPQPVSKYYTVFAKIYEASSWKNKPELLAMVGGRKVTWLVKNDVYPNKRPDGELELLWERFSKDKPAHAYRLLSFMIDDHMWHPAEQQNAIHWMSSPQERVNILVEYKGRRLELSGWLGVGRVFYVPEEDSIVEFYSEEVWLPR
jgi:hypothetical protein